MNENIPSHNIDVPHLEVSLRTLLGIAADRMHKTGRKTYTLRYKHMDIGKVSVRPHKTPET